MYIYTYTQTYMYVHFYVHKMKNSEGRNKLVNQLVAMRLCSVHMLDGIGKRPQGHKQSE